MSGIKDVLAADLTPEKKTHIDLLKQWQNLGKRPYSTPENLALLQAITESKIVGPSFLAGLSAGFEVDITLQSGTVVHLPGRDDPKTV